MIRWYQVFDKCHFCVVPLMTCDVWQRLCWISQVTDKVWRRFVRFRNRHCAWMCQLMFLASLSHHMLCFLLLPLFYVVMLSFAFLLCPVRLKYNATCEAIHGAERREAEPDKPQHRKLVEFRKCIRYLKCKKKKGNMTIMDELTGMYNLCHECMPVIYCITPSILRHCILTINIYNYTRTINKYTIPLKMCGPINAYYNENNKLQFYFFVTHTLQQFWTLDAGIVKPEFTNPLINIPCWNTQYIIAREN